MESNGELFGWNPLKISQEIDVKGSRKRKISREGSPKQVDKDPLSLDVKKITKRDNIRKGKFNIKNSNLGSVVSTTEQIIYYYCKL